MTSERLDELLSQGEANMDTIERNNALAKANLAYVRLRREKWWYRLRRDQGEGLS
jgi:hypothetical protein